MPTELSPRLGLNVPPAQELDGDVHQILFRVLNHTGTAVFLVDAQRALLFASPGAEVLLKHRDALLVIGDRLAARSTSLTARLGVWISAMSVISPGDLHSVGMLSIPRPGKVPLVVLVAPFRSTRVNGAPAAALILCRALEEPRSTCDALRSLYQLTPVEARIAQLLTAGLSLKQIAALQGSHVQTVRKQLRMIFAKTDTHRQAQLVALVIRSTSMLVQSAFN